MQTTASVVDSALDVIGHSKACVGETRKLLSATRYRIAASRRRLNPAFALAGGSINGDMHGRVLERLLNGQIGLLLEGECWAGIARGDRTCSVCDGAIDKEDIEYEIPRGRSDSDYAHFACYLIWRQESRRLAAKKL